MQICTLQDVFAAEVVKQIARVSSSSYITIRCKLDLSDFLEALFSACSTSPFSHLYWCPHFLSNDVPRCHIWKLLFPTLWTPVYIFIQLLQHILVYPGVPSPGRCPDTDAWAILAGSFLMWRSSSSIPSSSQVAEVLTLTLWECPATLFMAFCAFVVTQSSWP